MRQNVDPLNKSEDDEPIFLIEFPSDYACGGSKFRPGSPSPSGVPKPLGCNLLYR